MKKHILNNRVVEKAVQEVTHEYLRQLVHELSNDDMWAFPRMTELDLVTEEAHGRLMRIAAGLAYPQDGVGPASAWGFYCFYYIALVNTVKCGKNKNFRTMRGLSYLIHAMVNQYQYRDVWKSTLEIFSMGSYDSQSDLAEDFIVQDHAAARRYRRRFKMKQRIKDAIRLLLIGSTVVAMVGLTALLLYMQTL